MSAVPADTYPLPGLPLRDVRSDCVDAPGDLMPGDARVLQTGEAGLLYEEVTVADAASFNLDPDLGAAGSGIGRSTISKFPPGLLTCATFIIWSL